MIIILFGLAGSGKNYVGKIIADEFGYYFVDADEFLTEEMKASVAQHKPFEQSMRDQYTELVIQKIKELQQNYNKLVMSKALYKEKNRQQILTAFPGALLVQIRSQPSIIADRVGTRDHLINASYANLISQGFEDASHYPYILNNSDKNAVVEQLYSLLGHRHD